MALLERVSTLVRANLNDLIDKAEEPEKMIKQVILDMHNQLLQVKTQVAIAIADQHLLEKKKVEKPVFRPSSPARGPSPPRDAPRPWRGPCGCWPRPDRPGAGRRCSGPRRCRQCRWRRSGRPSARPARGSSTVLEILSGFSITSKWVSDEPMAVMIPSQPGR